MCTGQGMQGGDNKKDESLGEASKGVQNQEVVC